MAVRDKSIRGTKAHQRYYKKDGTQVPGVTTPLNLLAKPALIPWANRMGLNGIDINKYVDKAAEMGTCAHLMAQYHLAGEEPDLDLYSPYVVDKAENGFIKFLDWHEQYPIEPILLEKPLVSEIYSYGGTIDCYGYLHGKPALVDLKTGSGIFPEMKYQVAAYRQLLIENGYPVDRVFIVRIGRDEEEATFKAEEVSLPELEVGFKVFGHLLQIYYLTRNKRRYGR